MSLHATFFLDLLFSSGLQIQVSVFFMKKSREIFEAVIGSFIFKKLHLLALYNFIIYIFSTFFYFLGAQKFDDIKLATYRAAAKLYFVQKSTNCKFFDHLLSLLSLLICRVVQSWADLGFLCLHVLALSYKRSFHSHCTQMGSSDFNNFNDFWSECQNVRILVLEIAQLIASSHDQTSLKKTLLIHLLEIGLSHWLDTAYLHVLKEPNGLHVLAFAYSCFCTHFFKMF